MEKKRYTEVLRMLVFDITPNLATESFEASEYDYRGCYYYIGILAILEIVREE
jgi:hypothetical protein